MIFRAVDAANWRYDLWRADVFFPAPAANVQLNESGGQATAHRRHRVVD
jgi:hypothetical protein